MMKTLTVRCVHCHDDVLCRQSREGVFEFDHFCVPPARPVHVPGWRRSPVISYSQDPRAAWEAIQIEGLAARKRSRLISRLKNQTINRIKPLGAAVSSSEKSAQTRANSGVAKNPSKQKRRFPAKKNQTNNQTSH